MPRHGSRGGKTAILEALPSATNNDAGLVTHSFWHLKSWDLPYWLDMTQGRARDSLCQMVQNTPSSPNSPLTWRCKRPLSFSFTFFLQTSLSLSPACDSQMELSRLMSPTTLLFSCDSQKAVSLLPPLTILTFT